MVIRGILTKVAYATAFALCQKGIQVVTLREDEHEKLIRSFGSNLKVRTCLFQGATAKRYGWWEMD